MPLQGINTRIASQIKQPQLIEQPGPPAMPVCARQIERMDFRS
jgi:hypothetical protein